MHELMHPDAVVELMPGGRYDVWPGATNRVLAFVPGEMLSVSGSAPEQYPEVRKGGTWAMYTFEPAGDGQTRLRLTTLGWKPGEAEWDAAFDYFLKANPQYLRMVRDKIEGR
jgi:hypothetical protein